jgi:hypothetical protein
MKIRVTFKDPDRMPDAVADALADVEQPSGVSAEEWSDIKESRSVELKAHITERWMDYGEYLRVEFDTDAGTATVLPAED